MNNNLSGLSQLNIELTSKCFKNSICFFCGHQDRKINPNLKFGDMDFNLLKDIRSQVDKGIIISLHRDGEPTDYPQLGKALKLFKGYIVSIVTHGENLARKAKDIIDNCTMVTISVFKGDPDHDMQLQVLREFLKIKGNSLPNVQIKIVGEMDEACYTDLGLRIIRRGVHLPNSNAKYAKRNPTVPEVGVCLDFLSRPTIDWRGRMFICNRLDTEDKGYLGDLKDNTISEIWNGEKRQGWLGHHIRGERDKVPMCKGCLFWGVPT